MAAWPNCPFSVQTFRQEGPTRIYDSALTSEQYAVDVGWQRYKGNIVFVPRNEAESVALLHFYLSLNGNDNSNEMPMLRDRDSLSVFPANTVFNGTSVVDGVEDRSNVAFTYTPTSAVGDFSRTRGMLVVNDRLCSVAAWASPPSNGSATATVAPRIPAADKDVTISATMRVRLRAGDAGLTQTGAVKFRPFQRLSLAWVQI